MEYTIEQQEKIGNKIAEILMLRKSREHHGRFNTAWGTKTPVGIFNIILHMAEAFQNGGLLKED